MARSNDDPTSAQTPAASTTPNSAAALDPALDPALGTALDSGRDATSAAPAGSPVRILQVGLGTWGESWAEVVSEVPEVASVGWVDSNPAALAGAPASVATFESLQKAIAALEGPEAPEAVLITAGLSAHAPLAKAALEAGLHVITEKPFTPTLREARELVDLAAANERTLMVSQNYRFHAAPQRVAAMLQAGAIGALGAVQVDFRKRFRHPVDHPYRRSMQPLLLDMFVHHADLMRFVLGREARSVECVSWNPPWSGFEHPASAALSADFGDGLVATWRGSWESTAQPTRWSGDWWIEGTDGAIAWSSRGDPGPWERDVAILYRDGEAEPIDLEAPDRTDRHGSLTAFAHAIRSGTEPTASGRDNLGTLEICLAAIRSAEEGERVPIMEP